MNAKLEEILYICFILVGVNRFIDG